MIFKDRTDAANKLFLKLKNEPLLKGRKNVTIVSLLRGGIILGDILARKLGVLHIPLVCAKISAPDQEELAIGGLVFDVVYLEKSTIQSLTLSKLDIRKQIAKAQEKFVEYCEKFSLKEKAYDKLSGKTAVIVDDGIATGATMKAAALFAKEKGARVVVVAAPVASAGLDLKGIDKIIILHKDPYFSAVSQFYTEFPQIPDGKVKELLS